MVPKIKVTYLKPKSIFPEMDSHKVVKSLQKEVLRQLRAKLVEAPFSAAAKRALSQSLVTRLTPDRLIILSTHPAFLPLIKGQKAEQMTWLTKADRPIPIVLDNGKVIFRSATPKSMADGKWHHPGREPTTILEKARKLAREAVKKRLKAELKSQVKKALRRI